MSAQSILLTNLTIYTEQAVLESGYILVEGERIAEIGRMSDWEASGARLGPEVEIRDFSGGERMSCIPGLIDVHIHGIADADVMDATEEALLRMAAALPEEGTTAFLATTLTQDSGAIAAALANAAAYIRQGQPPGRSEILGIHLEGPFLSPEKAGAQPKGYIRKPDMALFDDWQRISQGHIRLVTLAPEVPGGYEFIRHLHDQGVIASLGHSNAVQEEADRAVAAGASHVTHLFNGMRGIHHREPGLAGAALLRDELTVEIIADGIHLHPDMLELCRRMKPSDRMVLITDSIRAKCLADGVYDLGGQSVTVTGGRAMLDEHTLAGSTLKMNHAIRNMLRYTGCTLTDLIRMGSANPAKELGVYARKGSIAVDKDADLAVLDEQGEVAMTVCRGRIAYRREGGE